MCERSALPSFAEWPILQINRPPLRQPVVGMPVLRSCFGASVSDPLDDFGARALRAMMERIMLDVMYDVPSREDVAEVTINRSVVEGKKPPLLRRKQDKDAA